jgi:POTE ankyrin domain family protein
MELLRLIIRNDTDRIIQLLNNNIDINITYYDDVTPLILASFYNCHEITELLIKYRANPNKIDRYGNTALDIANINDHKKIIKLLVNYGGKYNRYNDNKTFRNYISKITQFKINMKRLTGNKPNKYFYINNMILIKLLSKIKMIYNNTGIPKSIIWLIGSYLFY